MFSETKDSRSDVASLRPNSITLSRSQTWFLTWLSTSSCESATSLRLFWGREQIADLFELSPHVEIAQICLRQVGNQVCDLDSVMEFGLYHSIIMPRIIIYFVYFTCVNICKFLLVFICQAFYCVCGTAVSHNKESLIRRHPLILVRTDHCQGGDQSSTASCVHMALTVNRFNRCKVERPWQKYWSEKALASSLFYAD